MTELVDCVYYLDSACLMESKCQYRHSSDAKATEMVCPLWHQGLCRDRSCRFRHTFNKKSMPCFFENGPGGCRRNNCALMHRKKNNFLMNPHSLNVRKKLEIRVKEKKAQSNNASASNSHLAFICKQISLFKRVMTFKEETKVEGNSKSLDYKIKILQKIKNGKKSNQDKMMCMILKTLKNKRKYCKPIAVSDLRLQKKNEKYAVKDLQYYIDCFKVLVPKKRPALHDTVNTTKLSSNSVSLNCNLQKTKSADVSEEPVSNSAVETNQQANDKHLLSLTSVEDEVNSSKKIKPQNSSVLMFDDSECLLDYEYDEDDMDMEETDISKDDDILLEVEKFLND